MCRSRGQIFIPPSEIYVGLKLLLKNKLFWKTNKFIILMFWRSEVQNRWIEFLEGLELGIFPAISVNKDAIVFSDSGPPNVNSWALRALKKEKSACTIWQPLGCSHSLWWALRNSGWEKCRILAPDSWNAHETKDFSESGLLHLPIHRKALNSLTWDIWFL